MKNGKRSHTKRLAEIGSQDLITIFPETAFGMDGKGPSNWFIGHIRNEAGLYYNSLSFNGYQYDKIKLVPFGEYVPFKFFDKFFNFFNFNRPQISSGGNNKIFESKDFSIYGSICYEVAYQDLYLKYAAKSNFLFTASNDAWFGQTIGPHQHLQIARFRALRK